VLCAGLTGMLLSGCGAAPGRPATADTYGALPSWLPEDTTPPNSTLVADIAHPALTSQGDEVEVHLAHASVRMTIVGPEVPGHGLPVQPVDTTCTWTVTVAAATAPVRLRTADFDTLDHRGTVYRVAAVPGRPAVPAVLEPGRTATFELRAAMPTGEGMIRWSGGTGQALASWDFVVETD
jgi:hypothetical protein